jgi:hypothetical protein
LKILPSDVATDQQRMNRFVQEARVTSGLNHPTASCGASASRHRWSPSRTRYRCALRLFFRSAMFTVRINVNRFELRF